MQKIHDIFPTRPGLRDRSFPFFLRPTSRLALRPHFLVSFLLGGLLGILLLHPITMAMYWLEFHPATPETSSFFAFAAARMQRAFSGSMLIMTGIFVLLGGGTALAGTLVHQTQLKRTRLLKYLSEELARDLNTLLKEGENEKHEFKAALRWDYRLHRANVKLEHVVLKTVVGFMNNEGGTILIGIDDHGQVLGLKNDYQTLKRPNRDGFEAHLMSLIARRIGTDFCSLVHILFHRYGDHDICRVLVEPSPRPTFLHENGRTTFYLRTGNTTRELNVEEATAYIRRHWPK